MRNVIRLIWKANIPKNLSRFIKLFSRGSTYFIRGSVPQIDRRKAKGRNERGKRESPIDRANRSPAQPIAHLYSPSAKLNQSGRTYRCLASLRAPRISITDRFGGYRFLLILKNGPKPLHERSPAKESAELLLPWNSLNALDARWRTSRRMLKVSARFRFAGFRWWLQLDLWLSLYSTHARTPLEKIDPRN